MLVTLLPKLRKVCTLGLRGKQTFMRMASGLCLTLPGCGGCQAEGFWVLTSLEPCKCNYYSGMGGWNTCSVGITPWAWVIGKGSLRRGCFVTETWVMQSQSCEVQGLEWPDLGQQSSRLTDQLMQSPEVGIRKCLKHLTTCHTPGRALGIQWWAREAWPLCHKITVLGKSDIKYLMLVMLVTVTQRTVKINRGCTEGV